MNRTTTHDRNAEIRGLAQDMTRYVDGDQQAFMRVYGIITPRMRSAVRKLVRDEATTDDLVQQALLKAHAARHRFEVRPGDPDATVIAWYLAIARHVALDFLRAQGRAEKRRVRARVDQDPIIERLASSYDPLQIQIDEEIRDANIHAVRDAIAELPETQRKVVELHKLGGLSMKDVADRLGIRSGAARVRAHRAYKTLHQNLATNGFGVAPVAA